MIVQYSCSEKNYAWVLECEVPSTCNIKNHASVAPFGVQKLCRIDGVSIWVSKRRSNSIFGGAKITNSKVVPIK